jgi:hypothetical protein
MMLWFSERMRLTPGPLRDSSAAREIPGGRRDSTAHSHSSTVTELATIRTSLGQCYDAIESLAGRMDATQWHARSLCPDWHMPGTCS